MQVLFHKNANILQKLKTQILIYQEPWQGYSRGTKNGGGEEEVGEGGQGDGEVEGGDDGLSGHVDEGDGELGDAVLVGHELIEVFTVGFEDVFAEDEAVDDGEDCVHSVNH